MRQVGTMGTTRPPQLAVGARGLDLRRLGRSMKTIRTILIEQASFTPPESASPGRGARSVVAPDIRTLRPSQQRVAAGAAAVDACVFCAFRRHDRFETSVALTFHNGHRARDGVELRCSSRYCGIGVPHDIGGGPIVTALHMTAVTAAAQHVRKLHRQPNAKVAVERAATAPAPISSKLIRTGWQAQRGQIHALSQAVIHVRHDIRTALNESLGG